MGTMQLVSFSYTPPPTVEHVPIHGGTDATTSVTVPTAIKQGRALILTPASCWTPMDERIKSFEEKLAKALGVEAKDVIVTGASIGCGTCRNNRKIRVEDIKIL